MDRDVSQAKGGRAGSTFRAQAPGSPGGSVSTSATRARRGRLPIRFRCHRCGYELAAYAPVERHVDGHGGGRIEVLIPTTLPERSSP